MKHYLWKCSLSLGLCFLLTFGGFLPVVHAQNAPGQIEIVVVEGEGASVPIRQHLSSEPAVRVEDQDHRPLSNVSVTFTLPLSGASGEFGNGSRTLTVFTDQNGVAVARGMRANDVPGKLQIYVSAAYRGLRARGLINMTVAAPPGAKTSPGTSSSKSSGKLKWILLGIAAAGGAGAGAYFYATRSTSGSPISVSAGSVVFGSPR
jgi:hypothetical protein